MDLSSLLFGLFLSSNPPAAAPGSPGVTPAAPPAARTLVANSPAEASALVDKVQSYYRRTSQLTAKFRQTVMNATFGRETISDGNVFIKKPGKMRWDYMSRARKTVVDRSFMSDGKVLWAVSIDSKTFYRKDAKEDLLPVAVTFLAGKGDLEADFVVTVDTSGKYGGAGDHVLALTPRKPSAQYKTLWLVVDRGDFRVKRSVILNSNGDVTRFDFFEPDTTTPIRDQVFVFNEVENRKKGFQVVAPPK